MAPVLKYHDGTQWTEVSTAGPQGPPGPSGATGPVGATGPDEVVIAAAAPPLTPDIELWVDTATPTQALTYLPLTGGALTGDLDMAGLVVRWSDVGTFIGGIVGGDLFVGDSVGAPAAVHVANPTIAQHAATKGYADSLTGGMVVRAGSMALSGTVPANGALDNVQVDFGFTFAQPPVVSMTVRSNGYCVATTTGATTTTGFITNIYNVAASIPDLYGVDWIAVGVLA